ncbi:MAG: hypothetical protein LBO79_09470 [Zoogloeaceae bacterium]|jgi:hypothetical protein|nr:hypothetical protein [Zoogloeaceae bacterium]
MRGFTPRSVSGAVLLGLVMLLTLGGLTWLVVDITRFNGAATRNAATDRALAEAKEALLGYAAAYPELHLKAGRAVFVPGHLPCPDMGSPLGLEGTESGVCGAEGVTVVGHFPWRSLGVPPPRDGYGECLWYAVSGHYKANPKARLLNPDIPGQFEIVDEQDRIIGAAAERPVAVLFAPGPPLSGQERADAGGECRWNYDARHFLDMLGGVNNAVPNTDPEGVTRLAAGRESAEFNDRLLWIHRAEVFARVAQRQPLEDLFDAHFGETGFPGRAALAQRVAACLARFGARNAWRRLPWAAPLALAENPPLTFQNDAFADRQDLLAGRPPFLVTRSQARLASTLGTLPTCASGNTACRLLRSDNCPELAAVDGGNTANGKDGWFDKWKDHLFYLVAPGFAPAEAPAADCSTTPEACIEVEGRTYAAAVIFAGAPQAGQERDTNIDRMNATRYLEGENALTVQNGGRRLEVTGNDRIVCLEANADGFTLVNDCGAP